MAGPRFKYLADRRLLCLITALCAACLLVSCDQPNQLKDSIVMAKCDYLKVEMDSDLQNECSPVVNDEEDFEGILINAPEKIEFKASEPADDGSFALIPICGYYMLDMGELLKDATISFVAESAGEDDDDPLVFSGKVISEDPSPTVPLPPEAPELTPEDLEGQFQGSYFNYNLAKYVKIPSLPGKYKVHVTVGKYISNKIELELVRE